MSMILWIPIKDYEEYYQAGSDGNIKALKRTWYSGMNGCIKKTKEEHLMKFKLNKYGYLDVSLTKNGKPKTFRVSRIIAQAFIDNPLNKLTVNHKNGIKTDNSAANLEWMTSSENSIHAVQNGLMTFKKGSEHHLFTGGPKSRRKTGPHNDQKLVLNLDTGIYYDSCAEAARILRKNYNVLILRLNGTRKNNTSLIYA